MFGRRAIIGAIFVGVFGATDVAAQDAGVFSMMDRSIVILEMVPSSGLDYCEKPCWEEKQCDSKGRCRPLCVKEDVCARGCGAEKLPPGGRCFPRRPASDVCTHEIAPIARDLREAANCAADGRCKGLLIWGRPRCAIVNRGEPCLSATTTCPLDAPIACIRGMCAKAGTEDPERSWNAFVQASEALDRERRARGQLKPAAKADGGVAPR